MIVWIELQTVILSLMSEGFHHFAHRRLVHRYAFHVSLSQIN
jgi:hypothetical protein